jgi:proteasome assembly chaperone (PAC2) family protein
MSESELVWEHTPKLTSPILIAGFEGWNDAGDAASTSIAHLAEQWNATSFAHIECENFFDFTSTRPQVQFSENRLREITWPENIFLATTSGPGGRDLILLRGNEPQLRWKTFSRLIIEVATTLKVEMVITLGALLADVPHTRPVRVTGTAIDQSMIDRLELSRSRYEGPTGIVGVLHDALARAEISSCSLWASVPHYLPGTPSPKAALALLERTAAILNIDIPTLALQIRSAQYERQVDEVVEADDDMVGYVRRLEISHDSGDDEDDDDADDIEGLEDEDESPRLLDANGQLPSGDELAAEVEKFLRDQGR